MSVSIEQAAKAAAFNDIRQLTDSLTAKALQTLPATREASLIITKLEEASMWASNGMAKSLTGNKEES